MLDKICGIYCITCISNNKEYIGSSINTKRRRTDHFSNLTHNHHYNPILQRSFNKYGRESFTFEVLLECPKGELLIWEQKIINDRNPEFNICKTAGRPVVTPVSKITRSKLSEIQKKRYSSSEERKKASERSKNSPAVQASVKRAQEANRGRKRSEEVCVKIREANKGRIHTEESRRNMAESHKGRIVTEETRRRIGESNKANLASPAGKKKHSEAMKKAWDKRRCLKSDDVAVVR